MNKKYLLLSLFPLLIVTACDGNKELDRFKELLNKQDLSAFIERSFIANYEQNFDVYNAGRDENINDIDSLKYHGASAFGYQYKVNQEQYNQIINKKDYNAFDFMKAGIGYYGLIQSAEVNSYNYDYEEDEESIEIKKDYQFTQQITAKFTNDLQVASNYRYIDKNDGEESLTKRFNGLVDKASLFDTISTTSLAELFYSTNLFDGPRVVQVIDNLYYSICSSLIDMSNNELEKVISNYNILINEDNDLYKVSFDIDDEEFQNTLINNEIFPGIIKGTLTYDRVSGEYKGYEYEISYNLQEKDDDGEIINSTSMVFKANGYSSHKISEEDPYIDPNPVYYDTPTTFVDDMAEGIIPPVV